MYECLKRASKGWDDVNLDINFEYQADVKEAIRYLKNTSGIYLEFA